MPLKPNRITLFLSLLFVVALALRLVHIDRTSFWLDEVLQTRCASSHLGEIWQCYPHDKPPLDYYVQWCFMQFGHGETVARLHAALIGAGFVAVMAWWGWLTGGARVGLLAAGLSFALPYSIRYSQEARPYALLLTSEALFLALMTRVLWHRRPARSLHWYLLAIVVGVYLLSLFIAWYVVAMVAAFVAAMKLCGVRMQSPRRVFPTRAERLTLALASIAVLAVALLPLVRAGSYLSPPGAPWNVANVGREVISYLKLLVGGYNPNQFSKVPAIVLFLPAAAGLTSVLSRHRTRRPVAILAALTAGGAFCFAFFFAWFTNHWMEVRYTLGVLPPLLLIIALGADVLICRAASRLGLRKAAPFARRAALAAALAYALVATGWVLAKPLVRSDWRGVARHLKGEGAEGTVLTIDRAIPLEYYLQNLGAPLPVVSAMELSDPLAVAQQPSTHWIVASPGPTPELVLQAGWAPKAFEGLTLFRADDPTKAPANLTAELRGAPLGTERLTLKITAADLPSPHLLRGWRPGTLRVAGEGEMLFALTEPMPVVVRLRLAEATVADGVLVEVNGGPTYTLNAASGLEVELPASSMVGGLNRLTIRPAVARRGLELESIELSVKGS